MNTDDLEVAKAESRSARRWMMYIGVFFLGQACLWTVALSRVSGDPSHAVVDDYDRRALSWDEQRARREASARLGWNREVALQAGDPGTVSVVLTDADGNPVAAERVEVTIFHRAAAAQRQTVALERVAPGTYVGHPRVDRSGLWRVELSARQGPAELLAEDTLTVGEGAAS